MASLAQKLNRNPMLELIPHSYHQHLLSPLHAALWAICLVGWLSATQAYAHELEDGFVERSVAVVVRPDNATISYSIGANEVTRGQLVAMWTRDQESEASEAHLDDGNSQQMADTSFLRVVGDAVVKGTTVEVDGTPVSLELVEVIPTPRHPVEATVVMRMKLPTSAKDAGSIALKVYDRNFEAGPRATQARADPHADGSQELPVLLGGAFRYAIKGAKGVMLNRSTVAPILVRAKRRLVAEIPADQIDAEQQFSAEVILP